jgi:general secretion pathway protein E
MGVEPFLVSSSLLAILAQRLVRRLCPHCRVPYEISDEELLELSLNPVEITSRLAYRPGSGTCNHCQGSGYSGRLGIHELLLIDDAVRSQILQRADSNTIKNSAIKRGFATLRADGGLKVLSGMTSVEEVLIASHDDIV